MRVYIMYDILFHEQFIGIFLNMCHVTKMHVICNKRSRYICCDIFFLVWPHMFYYTLHVYLYYLSYTVVHVCYVHTFMYVYIRTHTHTHISNANKHMHRYTDTCSCVHICIYTYICTFTYSYLYIYVYIQICVCVCIHIQYIFTYKH